MEHFQAVFEHWPQYRVIFCKSCRFCPVPSQIARHLKEHHSYVAPPIQRQIVEVSRSIAHVAQQPSEVQYPHGAIEPIAELPVLSNLFQCVAPQASGDACGYICQSVKHMQKHGKQQHGWENIQKRGGNTHGGVDARQQQTPNRIWVDGCQGQQFFRFDKWKHIFPVVSASRQDVHVDEIVLKAERQLAAQKQAIEEFQKHKAIGSEENRYVANGWLDRAGWQRHLAAYSKEELGKFVAIPSNKPSGNPSHHQDDNGSSDDGLDECEPALWRACQSTLRIIRAAQKASHPSVVGLAALQFVNRKETGQKNSEKPFYGRQMGKTIRKYAKQWIHILSYIWRTHDDVEPKPAYKLTRRQAQCLRRLRASVENGESSRDHRQRVDEACLAWWISLLDHPLQDHEYDSAMVSGMAVLGWSPHSSRWREATTYTPIISAIVTVARMLVIYQAKCVRHHQVQQLREDGQSADEADEQATSHFELVQGMVQRFMTMVEWGGKPSPMSFLLSLRTYGFTIRFNTPGENMISWQKEEIQCGGIRFTMSQFRQMIHGLVAQCREQLFRDVLLLQIDAHGQIQEGTTPFPPLDLDSLVDNPSQSRDGFSFLQDPRNRFSVNGETWLYHRVVRESRLRRKWIDTQVVSGDDSVAWRIPTITRHFRAVTRFKRNLYALVHPSIGGPWRGSEGPTIQYRNSADSDGRGMFISHGMVQFTTGYHKGYGHSGKPKIIHRFASKEVSELIVYYLWLAEPFVQLMQGIRDQQREFSPFLWEPDPNAGEDEDEEDEAWAELEREEPGEEGGTLEQFEVVVNEVDNGGRDGEDDEAFPSHIRHGRVRASARKPLNVDGFWGSSKVRYVLQKASQAAMDVSMTIRALRHIIKAIIREYSHDPQVQGITSEDHDMEVRGDDFHDRQFGHSGHIAGMLYGRDLMEAPHHTISEREAFRRVSIEWHRFLQFASSHQPSKTSRVHIAPEIQRQRIRRLQALERMDLRAALRMMVGNEHAEFRGQQEEALQAIVHRVTPIVVVMGTSAGKSALFMLPAAMSPRGLTIVVVPVISLRQDLAQRCTNAGIQCVEWQARRPADGAQIVLVTPESMASDAFQTFTNRQRALGVLDRIIVDEGHMILECEKGWRMVMRRALEKLAQYHVQVVYLTATLEPSVEDTFYRMTGIAAEHVHMIRGSTTRRNIAYQVRPYNREREEDVIQATVAQLKQQYPLPGQIIIYCRTVEQTESLARLLGCQAYHRNIGSEEEKRDILRQLVTGQQHVFTATNALGLGIDRGSIRVVMHVGVPRQMRAYAQESGRAGRDGLASEAIIMRPGYVNSRGEWRACGESDVQPAMRDFIQGQQCRRVVLDHSMDGRIDRVQCEMGEEMCDICRPCRPEASGRPEVLDDAGEVRPAIDGDGENLDGDEDVDTEVEDQPPRGPSHDPTRRKRDIAQVEEGHMVHDIGRSKRRYVAESERHEFETNDAVDIDPNREQVRQDAALAIHRARRCEESQQAQQLESILDAWQDRCPLCVVCQEPSVEHTLADCRHPRAGTIREERQQARRRIRFQRFAACWDCGLPQEICESWVRGPNGRFRKERGTPCQYGGSIIFDVFTAVLLGAEDKCRRIWIEMIQAWIREDEGEAAMQEIFQDEDREWQWYGQKIIWGGMETSQFVRAFYRCAVVAQDALARYK